MSLPLLEKFHVLSNFALFFFLSKKSAGVFPLTLPIVLAGGGRFVAVRGVLVVVVTFSVVVTATARVVRGVVHSGNTSFVVFLESGLISGISVVV